MTLTRQVARRMKDSRLPVAALKYEENANNLDKEVSIIRDLILYGSATRRNIAVDDEDEDKE